MTKTLTLALVFLFSVANAKQPIHYQKWQHDDTTFSKQIGGVVRNYQKPNKDWDLIVNGFEVEGDSVVYVEKSVLRTRVNKNGVSKVMLTWEGQEYTVTQKMLGIGWIKKTKQSQWIDSTMNWGNFSMDSNICKWTGVSPGVDYRVRKSNGQVEHGIFYKPAFLDSAVVLYNQRPDSLDIALANVMVYTLSSNIDNADSAMGELPWRRLKDFGYYTFNLRNQWLCFPGCDTLPQVPVKQYWERRGTKIICIEYVMMKHVKQVHEAYPGATIWHNDTKTIDGTTNVEDASILSSSPNNNYGGTVELYVKYTPYDAFVRVKNVSSELGAGATITACVCSLYCSYNGADGTISGFRIFKPWVEGDENGVDDNDGDVTYNDWASDTYEWTTEGCLCADDDGVDNSYDDGVCNQSVRRDRKATAESSTNVTTVNTWYAWTVSAALAQDWYDGTANENGIFFAETASGFNAFYSTESAEIEKPFWVFTYTKVGVKKIQGTTNVEDTYIYSGVPDYNYGGSGLFQVKLTEYSTLIRVQNVASEIGAGATISACVCSAYVYSILGGGGNTAAFIVFKPWNEGTEVSGDPDDAAEGEGVATWVDWSNDDEEWTTAGCNSADDGGVDNSGDGTGADRKETAEDTESITEVGWYSWSISSTIAQAWYNGTKNEEGILLMGDGGVCRFYSIESADSRKPFWVFTYTTDGEEVGTIMRTVIR